MTKSLNKRLNRLEQREAKAVFRIVVVDGTRDEVERTCNVIEAEASPGEHITFQVIVPYQGESVNQFREREGLPPLDILGWNETAR